MPGEAIWVEGLHKTFMLKEKGEGLRGGFKAFMKPCLKQVEAVKGVSFGVDQGETLAFIGPNGAGKSTTIKMLTGILYPTGGNAHVLGHVPWEARRDLAFHIGSVFGQRSQLWYHLPPADSFNLLARIYEVETREYKERLGQLVQLFDLSELMSIPVRKMSLGQRMRCEIAGSLLHRPRVIFLDEPTIGLDVVAKQRIRDLITGLNRQEGLTVFLTSHDAGDIEQLCKRVIIINHGKMVTDTSITELKRDYLRHKLVGLRMADDADPARMSLLPGVEVVKHKGRGIKLKVDTKMTDVSHALAGIMAAGDIEDITISDPPLEQIISQIYQDRCEGEDHETCTA